MTSGAHDRVVIVGAGPAGLATALALAQRGIRAQLIDPGAPPGDGGLQLTPNGVRILDALGVGEALRADAVIARSVEVRDPRSWRCLYSFDLSRYGADYILLRRSRLLAVLEAACRQAGLDTKVGCASWLGETGKGVVGWRRDDGSDHEAGLLIGADGARSGIREALNGRSDQPITHIAWRAHVPDIAPPAPGRIVVALAAGRHLVMYGLADGSTNAVFVYRVSSDHDPPSPAPLFAGFGGPVRQVLERCDGARRWRLRRSMVAPRWHGERTVLVGDALHPMLPFLAQGTNMALEDACVLADAIATENGCDAAFKRYRSRREPRLRRVVRAIEAQTWINHASWPPMRLAVKGALTLSSRLMPSLIAARYDWLFGGDGSSGR